MKIFYKVVVILLSLSAFAEGQDMTSYKVSLDYKAYWAGFVIADITSETFISNDEYQIFAHYEVGGIARLFNKSANDTLSRGIRLSDGEFRPEYYESVGNFGKLTYLNKVKFDPDTLKVTKHDQELNLGKDAEYIPIPEEEKFGADPMSIFLNMIMIKDFNEAYKEPDTKRQFGGIFVSEQSFVCEKREQMKPESRSVFEGDASICAIDGKLIAGNIKRKKKREKPEKSRFDDDRKIRLWFGKLDGFDATVPVYTELPIGWGKVRIYLSNFNIEAANKPTTMTKVKTAE